MSHQGQEAIADDSQRLMSFNGRPQPLSRLKLDGFGEKISVASRYILNL